MVASGARRGTGRHFPTANWAIATYRKFGGFRIQFSFEGRLFATLSCRWQQRTDNQRDRAKYDRDEDSQ
jgi:hypothetical protein